MFGKALRFADALDLERDGVHRLLEVVEARVGKLVRRWSLATLPGGELPADESDDEQCDMREGMGPLAHRYGVTRAGM